MSVRRCGFQAKFVLDRHLTFLLVFFVSCVDSRFFSYEDTTTPLCNIFVDVDFSVKTTAMYHGHKVAEKIWTADDVTKTNGQCDSAGNLIELYLGSGNIRFTLLSTSGSFYGLVKLSPGFKFQATSVFPQLESNSGLVCFAGSTKTLGHQTSSYVCSREDKTYYRRTRCDGEIQSPTYKYSLEMDIKKIHLQAYNVRDNVFSHPVFCEAPTNIVGIIAGSVVAVVVLLVLVVLITVLVLRRKKKPSPPDDNNVQGTTDEKSALVGSSQQDPHNNCYEAIIPGT